MKFKSTKSELKKRGFVSEERILSHTALTPEKLIFLLNSQDPCDRTISARIIAKKQDYNFIEPLIYALSNEKKLYSKIAISEALGLLGVAAIEKCIPWLGKIGNNQYKNLPDKPFMKENYPLPRDIIARTICKAGAIALPILMRDLNIKNEKQMAEGIDAIGYLSFYTKNHTAKTYILDLFTLYETNSLLTWKLIRALESFPTQDVINFLKKHLLHTSNQVLLWEAKRSLSQIEKQSIELEFK